MRKHILTVLISSSLLLACNSSAPQLGEASVDEVMAAMTLEEKVLLLIGTGMEGMTDGDSAVVGATKQLVPGAAGTTRPVERLGIPAIVLADGPAGLRIDPTRQGDEATYYCTHFPIGTLLASTWNQPLVEAVGTAIGNEVLQYGADVLLAPALNIHRNPLCGRNFEYYSEDPVVTGKMAAAYVRGVQSNGVGTSIKHFAANNQESNRMNNDTRVSQRALREIYLKGFEIAVKEGAPWTVMSSYNLVNGTPVAESRDMQTTLLRDEWGFDGMVMTDWFGGKDASRTLAAGNDMLQPGFGKQYDVIMQALQAGTLTEAEVDICVKRALELILKTPRFKGHQHTNKPDLQAHAAVTRQSATEGMVLLKNNRETLPLKQDVKRVALFGCTSYQFIAGGTGSGNVNRAYTVSLLDGLTQAGYEVNQALQTLYTNHIEAENKRIDKEAESNSMARWLPRPMASELTPSAALLKEQVAQNDVALITIGRQSGEFLDRTLTDFNLNQQEQQLISQVCKAFQAAGKRVVVILNVGGVIETDSWKGKPDAILCAWQAGQEGGNSVADVLSGKVSPSGKLTMTFPIRWKDHASSANFPTEGKMSSMNFTAQAENKGERLWDYTEYQEDIYVGYRYFDSFQVPVSYPFGYGLSYTTFAYGKPTIESSEAGYTIRVEIKNSGKAKGKEVVQLYVSAPDNKALNKPAKELKAFAKTKELQPGESEIITLQVDAAQLASYDEGQDAWVVDEGLYEFMVAASSRDIKGSVTASAKALTIQTNDLLKPQADFDRLTRK